MNEKQLDKTLRELLDNHKKWVESNGESGERLDLSDAYLSGVDFYCADLSKADFYGTNFRHAHFRLAYLTGVDLRGATITVGEEDL